LKEISAMQSKALMRQRFRRLPLQAGNKPLILINVRGHILQDARQASALETSRRLTIG